VIDGHAGHEPAEKESGKEKSLLVVISAPSGAGKTSLLREIFARNPEIRFSVSATTRPPRPEERDGVDYFFVSEEEFDRLIAAKEFIEWAVVHGCRYGTPRNAVREGLGHGGIILFDTDTVGAKNIKTAYPDAVLIFIAPPCPGALRARLEKRGTDTPENIGKRLAAAPREMRRAHEYDYIVVNDTLEEAIAGVEAILRAESLRSERMLPSLREWRMCLNGESRGF